MTNVDAYLASIESPQRNGLERIREQVQAIVPEATEAMSYGMPAFKYKGKYLIGYAAFKNHMSVFPGAKAVAVLESKLDNYVISKGTIQFTVDQPIPDKLLREILQIRRSEIEGVQ